MIVQACKPIQQMIEETDVAALRATLPGDFPYDPYPYQWAAHRVTAQEIRDYEHPFIIKAAVSAGKTTLISLVTRRLRDIGKSALVLSRQGEIVEQDSDEMSAFKVINSRFCASLNKRSAHFPIVCGSEGTVVNALWPGKKLAAEGIAKPFVPQFLLIDESHHVCVTDIIDSERNGETTLDEMKAMGRKSYTLIIRELQRRCMARYGRPLVIIGYTGTDYRGVEPIINTDLKTPGFWRKKIVDIDTDFLVKFGAVVPTIFGANDGLGYDLSEFHSDGSDGDKDFSNDELMAMQRKILDDSTMTQMIMRNVVEQTINRNGVLVTCAGLKHCQEAAKALPAGTSYGIVTQETPKAERLHILHEAKVGRMKFVFQVGCLTTGINCPPWDTIVILRRIGSLTLLVQLIGRGMRILKQFHIDAGIMKEDNLVLDYTGTMGDLAAMYFSPMLEQYQYEEAVRNNETIPCPKCGTENSMFARRCIGEDAKSDDGRCEYFFKSRICEDIEHPRIKGRIIASGCGAENDIAARFCRKCSNMLIDPNKKLTGAAYTNEDYCDVLEFSVEAGRGTGSIAVRYRLRDPETQEIFQAWEIHWPFNYENRGARAAWRENFVKKHVAGEALQNTIMRCKTVDQILANSSLFMRPDRVTHRKINEGKKDVITRKVFNSEGKDFLDD